MDDGTGIAVILVIVITFIIGVVLGIFAMKDITFNQYELESACYQLKIERCEELTKNLLEK